MKCNNPVFVADKERKVLWPEQAAQDPDIFLSIGTGFDRFPCANVTEEPPEVPKLGITSFVLKMIKMGAEAMREDMNCELVWQQYIQGISLNSDPHRSRRYQRLNLPIEGPIPKLDEVDQMEDLRNRARKYIIGGSGIKEVARVLRASLFYFELRIVTSTRPNSRFMPNQWDCDLICTGNEHY